VVFNQAGLDLDCILSGFSYHFADLRLRYVQHWLGDCLFWIANQKCSQVKG